MVNIVYYMCCIMLCCNTVVVDSQNTEYIHTSDQLQSVPTNLIPQEVISINLTDNEISHLEALEFSSYTSLEVLVLRSNLILLINETAFYNTQIFYLDLGENSLTTIPYLHDIGQTLLGLYLDSNMIESLYLTDGDSALQPLQVLEHFVISDNPVNWTFTGSLGDLNASLVILDLGYIDFSSVTVPEEIDFTLVNIDEIYLNDCQLTVVPGMFPSATNLSVFDIGHNYLTDASLVAYSWNNSSVCRLDLSSNSLSTFPDFQINMRNHMEELLLGENNMSVVQRARLTDYDNLWFLELNDNVLTIFPKVPPLPSLTVLDLTNNLITLIPGQPFTDNKLPVLMELILTDNHITVVEDISAHLSSVGMQMYLYGNDLDCDCNFTFLLHASTAHNSYSPGLVHLDTQPCGTPASLIYIAYDSITVDDLLCNDTTTTTLYENTTTSLSTIINTDVTPENTSPTAIIITDDTTAYTTPTATGYITHSTTIGTNLSTSAISTVTPSLSSTTQTSTPTTAVVTTDSTTLSVICEQFPTWNDVWTNTTSHSLGQNITYQCKTGYQFTDSTTHKIAMCSYSNGGWTPEIAQCQEIEDVAASALFREPVEAKNASAIGSLMIICIIGFFAFIVSMDIPHLPKIIKAIKRCINGCKQLQKTKDNHTFLSPSKIQIDF